MKTFEIDEVAADLWALVDAVERGEAAEIILTIDGRPAARLVATSSTNDEKSPIPFDV